MPRIFDNITDKLQDALIQTLPSAQSADFCVGYFNLRGWRLLASSIDHMTGGDGHNVRLLIGMTTTPRDEVKRLFSLQGSEHQIDLSTAIRLKNKIVEDFRQQLTVGIPSDADEAGLRHLSAQLREKKLTVKLYLKNPLHAKLYLTHRQDYNNPRTAFLGSSNLTLAGLMLNGELNTDVTDYTATEKLAAWFNDRWVDKFCLDITDTLADIIDQSWAGESGLTPYEVYLKIAYHMAQEAIAGLSGEFKLPKEFADKLYDYQSAAVQIAAHHLNKRGGVLLGDVVGLGKTLMAAAIAKIFQEDHNTNALILCPPNLAEMWRNVIQDYGLIGDVLSTSRVIQDDYLKNLRRYRLVIIDESHNLRNAEGRRYAAIKDYIADNDCKVILLSATPYNKTYLDLAAQLGLFIPDNRDLGVRPEAYLRDLGGEAVFMSKHQTTVRTLAAFTHSPYPDDWRDLMRLYMVRRTRSFITTHYAELDPANGRKYIQNRDGKRSYFPVRIPKTVKYEANPQYRRLYDDLVVDTINSLSLPRHGLSLYVRPDAEAMAMPSERTLIQNLSRAGQRLIGFTRTGLFKRLESSGSSFLQSLDRHVLRNYVFLHALRNGFNLPIGTLDIQEERDEDIDPLLAVDENDAAEATAIGSYEARAASAYAQLSGRGKSRYKWLSAALFTPSLAEALEADNAALEEVLRVCGVWDADDDTKLLALLDLIQFKHPNEKILVFSQFADTVTYLERELGQRGVIQMAAATGKSADPTALARRFSPYSNRPLGSDNRFMQPADELRVLISTDVLSEGQNLQDAAIVVNFDLPWAIIRLSQRAGRVDRIGQQSEDIVCYSFLPADGVEQLIRLRARVRQRLSENGEVIGSDEQFFEDETQTRHLKDLYTEKSGIMDEEANDNDVDLASEAYQIWESATKHNEALRHKIEGLPDVVYSTRSYTPTPIRPAGVITYIKTATGADALTWMGADHQPITQSQVVILRAAACRPDTPAIERRDDHHELVRASMELIYAESQSNGGAGSLGARNGPRARSYERMKAHYEDLRRTMPLFLPATLHYVIDDLYHFPLTASARDTIVRQMRTNITDEALAQLLIYLREDGRLSQPLSDASESADPSIVCSLGLVN